MLSSMLTRGSGSSDGVTYATFDKIRLAFMKSLWRDRCVPGGCGGNAWF